MCKHRRGTAARRHITVNGHPAGGAARLIAPQGVLTAPSLLRAGLPPATSRKSRSTCSAPARVSRPRWSAKWKTSPPRAPSASPAPRPSPTPASIHKCVDHLMIYDVFAHLRSTPRRFGLCAARRGRSISRRAQHCLGGRPPLNTNGGLSYVYSIYALQKRVRRCRGLFVRSGAVRYESVGQELFCCSAIAATASIRAAAPTSQRCACPPPGFASPRAPPSSF